MEQLTGLLEQYFQETEPAKRKEILERLTVADCGGDSAMLSLLRKLYTLRYTDPKDPAAEVDFFLWHYVCLAHLSAELAIFKGPRRKEILKTLNAMGNSEAETGGDTGRTVLYWEYRNAARRYYGTMNSPSYGRKLFGTIAAKEDEKLIRMRKEARGMTFDNAQKYNAHAEMELFCKALDDEFFASTGERLLDEDNRK